MVMVVACNVISTRVATVVSTPIWREQYSTKRTVYEHVSIQQDNMPYEAITVQNVHADKKFLEFADKTHSFREGARVRVRASERARATHLTAWTGARHQTYVVSNSRELFSNTLIIFVDIKS